MKRYQILTLLALALCVVLLPTTTYAQLSLQTGTYEVVNDDDTEDPNRKHNTVTREEVDEALNRLNTYLKESLAISKEDIRCYRIFPNNKLTLQFKEEVKRPDTSIMIPASVNFPKYLISDYIYTVEQDLVKKCKFNPLDSVELNKYIEDAKKSIEKADKTLEKVFRTGDMEIRFDEAGKRIEEAKKNLERFSRTYHHSVTGNVDSTVTTTSYEILDPFTEEDDGQSVKVITTDPKGNIAVSISSSKSSSSSSKKEEETDDDPPQKDKKAHKSQRKVRYNDDEDIDRELYDLYKGLFSNRLRNFRGHWAGIELGFNWLLDPSFSLKLSQEQEPMRMNLGQAINWNINPLQYSIAIGSPKFGLVTGIGLNFNYYYFKKKNSLRTGDNAVIFHSDLQDQGHNVKSSRLFNWALTLPVLFEYQLRIGTWNTFYVSAGALLNVRLYSSTRVRYDKNQIASQVDSFNMNDVSLAPTLRIGYGIARFYVNFYPMGVFESVAGPKVYPIEWGLVLLRF